METSILVARMFAVVYIVVGIGMVLNAAYFKKVFDGMWKESGMIVLGGMMSLLAGFLLVTYHNLWVKDWTVVITVFGWLALLKGILIFLFPKPFAAFSKLFLKNIQLFGVFALVLGLFFGYFGYVA